MAAIVGFCLSFFVLSAATAHAAEIAWHVTGQVGGPTSAVAVQSDHAFLGVGFRVLIYDVSSPATPTEVGSTGAFPDLVTAISISGNRAFVTAGSAGLRIFDVSDVTHPAEIGAWDSPGYAEAVSVVSDRAYVADGPFGLQIVDVSDPRSPRSVSSCFDMNYAYDVVVEEGRAYIAAAGAGLLVADVSDPLHPIEIGALDTPGYARRVAVAGSVAYVADEWGGVRVVSIGNPAHPMEIASIALPSWAFGVALSGTTLFVADGSQGLQLFDVTITAQPRPLGAYEAIWQHAGAVALSGGRAYLALRTEGLYIVDIQNPRMPSAVGMAGPLATAVALLTVPGTAVVGAAEQGMRLVDLTGEPREIAAIHFQDGSINALTVLGSGIVVAGSSGIKSSGLYFIDIADPRNPRVVGSLPRIWGNEIDAEGSLVAVGTEGGPYLVDASDPTAPRQLSFLDFVHGDPLASLGGSVALTENILCATQAAAGLRLVDVSDPRSPSIVGTFKPDGFGLAQVVEARDHYAYVLTCPSRLWIADISDPKNPQAIANLPIPACGERIRLSGTTLLIANGAGGLITVDVSEPAHARITSSTPLPGHSFAAAGDGTRVIVAANESGVLILGPTGSAASDQAIASTARTPVAGATDFRQADGSERLRAIVRAQRAAATRLGDVCARSPVSRPGPMAMSTGGRTIPVKSAADSGEGSLREALTTLAAGDTVTFDPVVFPPGAPATIWVTSPLPCVCSNGILIDASNAGVILDGSSAPAETMGLTVGSNDNRILGLQIVNFPHSGLFVQGSRNVIGGDRARGTGPSGEANIVSGNFYSGINFSLDSASENRVVGNLIGTDASGSRPLGRQTVGVFLFPGGPGNIVGGTEAWEGNVISGNTLAEVFFQQARAATIVGNRIGTDPSGSKHVGACVMGLGTGGHTIDNVITGNVIAAQQQAVIVSDTGTAYNQVTGNYVDISPSGNALVSSDVAGSTGIILNESFNRVAGNVISGVGGWGINLGFWGTHDNILAGNLIGTDPSGERAVPNWGGIQVTASSHTFVGGTTPAERNVIAGNTGDGIELRGPGTDRNFVLGNFIGTDVTGQQPLGNGGSGVRIGTSNGNFIQDNVIAWNEYFGAFIPDSAGNRFRKNSIHANRRGGIVKDATTRTPAPPVITHARPTRAEGVACAGCVVEFFSDAAGQGELYEGTAVAAADGMFVFQKAAGPSGRFTGPNITATATDPAGGTSSFSVPVPVRQHVAVPDSPFPLPPPQPPEG